MRGFLERLSEHVFEDRCAALRRRQLGEDRKCRFYERGIDAGLLEASGAAEVVVLAMSALVLTEF